jgi:hypothetical protein
VFVDSGACPGEGCGYGVWRATRAVALRAAPSDTAPEIGTIDAGELACAVTGEVHTVPGRFVVARTYYARWLAREHGSRGTQET